MPEPVDWSQWRHAYGSSENLPDLLEALNDLPDDEDPNEEPYFSLWSSLCHQDTIYSASFAAVPFLVDAADRFTDRIPSSLLQLVTYIEVCRKESPLSGIPASLEPAYTAAIASLPRVASKFIPLSVSEGECRVLTSAIAAGTGHTSLARAILELEPGVLDDFMPWIESR